MACSVVCIQLGNDPVFNEDDEITRLAVLTFSRFAHALYEGNVVGDRDSFVGHCHDHYFVLVNTNQFPVVIDEEGETWEATAIYFNVLTACYERFLTTLLSSVMEIHKTSVITGVHSVHLRHSPYPIADIFFTIRYLITGPEIKPDEPCPNVTCRPSNPMRPTY